ncbi:MAG: VCBS repeat-containing protein [bacterium]
MVRPLILLVCAGLTASVTHAQIGWASFTKDNSRLNANNSTVMNDNEEKDYAWGDLDQDGWTDLVIVRKTPYTNPGGKVNVLLMNEGGVLTDRTAQYAVSSSVAGDNGFKTGTNDRDVAIADVNGDGWLDVITSAAIAPNQPKHISHPRVYINQGDMGGAWMGLRYEDALIPDFGTFPNFCAVAVGDLTGDGFPDLYFAHYEQSAQVDLNDKLLVNDGTGNFSDESNARMTSAMLDSSFAVSAVIADMNGDGNNDVIKDTALGSTGAAGPRVIIDYNNPTNVGFFNIYDQAYSGAPYHANVGDLNKDGKLDMIISDDAADRYLLNNGNDALGRVNWSAAFTYNTDDGFGSNNIVCDLNNDGWNDVLICDVDVDIPGCSRRMHVYHNKGGTVGGNITLKEESGGGSTGLKGITTSDLRGMHDVAVFDVDNDGDLDLVLGDCNGTNLFVNDLNQPGGPIGTNYCGPAVPNSSGFPAVMGASGSDQVAANNVTLDASMMPANQFGYFLTSQTAGFIANPGGAQGNLCLGGQMGRYSKSLKNSGSGGSFQLTIDLTNMPPPVQSSVLPGDTWNFAAWFRDKNPTNTSNFTDGLSILFL